MTKDSPIKKDHLAYSILLRDYAEAVEPTDDSLSRSDLQPILLGLYGEVGSIMAVIKKQHREGTAYIRERQAIEEELGDILWYFAALCRRLKVGIDIIFEETIKQKSYNHIIATSDHPKGLISYIFSANNLPEKNEALIRLGIAATTLLGIKQLDAEVRKLLCDFSDSYLKVVQATEMNFSKIARTNIEKVCGRFIRPDFVKLPSFDYDFPEEEQIPSRFEIQIKQQEKGEKVYLQWNGVKIGDPLTDSILDPDGYRFHDVLHFAHAAILHWSPAFRSLIKHKRKSDPAIDEAEDGGRALVIEEGLTAWVFSCAKKLNLFEGQNNISFDILKTIQQFIQGYEVEICPLNLWERAILEGYKAFRQMRNNNGGIVVGDRESRTIEYRPFMERD